MLASNIAPLVFAVVVGVPLAILWAMALVDLLHRSDWEFPPDYGGSNPRLFWMFVVVVMSGIGAFFYYITVMKPFPLHRG